MLMAMENLEALSSTDPDVVEKARHDVLMKHVHAIRVLFSDCPEAEIPGAQKVIKALAKDIGKPCVVPSRCVNRDLAFFTVVRAV
jgi:hypothetical protein